MAFYESTFIARQEISEKDVEGLTKKFTQAVEKSGGKVVKTEYWGLRSLTYPIAKSKKGHYTFLAIEGEGPVAIEIERLYRADEDVIRNLTVKVDELSKEESAILRSDNDDEPFDNKE